MSDVATSERWWRTAAFYQIYPRSFMDASGDGIGDLEGIIGRLDYLSGTLGVNAIWLSPVYPSPMVDFGYDVSDYCGVDPTYGDLGTLDRLIEAAHARGLRVLLDWVPNHTSCQHPWFQESKRGRSDPRRGWYIWRDPAPDGGPPNNWLSAAGGSAWTLDEGSGQYYLHSFFEEQADLNWRNPDVHAAMFDTLRFWLDRGVDGFRIDVAHRLIKDRLMRDNPPSELQRTLPNGKPDDCSQVHVFDQSHPDVHQLFRSIREVLDSYGNDPPRIAVGEVHVPDVQEWREYFGRSDQLHMPFNFALIDADWTAEAVRRKVDATEGAVPTALWPNYVLGNHDVSRVASRLGEEQARAAMLLLLTLRGTPTLYYGDELGMLDARLRPEQRLDPMGIRRGEPARGRDPQRAPMPWAEGPNAGFCPPEATPWLPMCENVVRASVEAQLRDPESMLNLTRDLLRLRREHEALLVGEYRPVERAPEDCFVFMREAVSGSFLTAVNFGERERELHLESLDGASLLRSSRRGRTTGAGEGLRLQGSLVLHGHEGCLVRLSGSRSNDGLIAAPEA